METKPVQPISKFVLVINCIILVYNLTQLNNTIFNRSHDYVGTDDETHQAGSVKHQVIVNGGYHQYNVIIGTRIPFN